MGEQHIQIVVDGTLVEGATPDQVKPRVAKLFKTTVDKVEPMFSGRPFAVKKGVDLETARKYQAALKQAGLIAKLIPMREAAAATPPSENSAIANIDASTLTIAAAGETLVKHAPVPKPEIDTRRYQMEPVGQTLDQTPRPTAPNIDISAMTMADVGEDVMEHLPIPEVDIDTSTLSMAEAGVTLMEHAPTPPAQIDISNIKLADE